MCLCVLPVRARTCPYLSLFPFLPQLVLVDSLNTCIELNSYKLCLAVHLRSCPNCLTKWEVYFSQIRIHEVGPVQVFKGAFRNAGSFSVPVLSSLVCGSQPQSYKMAGPALIITSAFQLRQSESERRRPQHAVTFEGLQEAPPVTLACLIGQGCVM